MARGALRKSLWVVGLVLPALARADGGGQPVLHEYLEDLETQALGGTPGVLPPTIDTNDARIPAPDLDRGSPSPGETTLGPAEDSPHVHPDRDTERDSTLPFQSVFNPDVVPFKRNIAFDAVGADYTLGLRDATRRPVDLARSAGPDRDLFYGSVAIDFVAGTDVLLPTPGADPEVLTYRVEPPTSLSFSRDAADNLYVRAPVGGPHRLVYLVSAPQSYFGATLPADVSFSEVPLDLVPTLTPSVRAAAADVLAAIGVDPRDPAASYTDVLARLVAYFRAFTPGDPPPGPDPYKALALAQRGVCRHRAFAFLVTAAALGIPTRYVGNESHVFVEAYVPRIGWMRIDLGGAARRLDVSGAVGKVLYRPRVTDPFPRPYGYSQGCRQLSTAISGLDPSQKRAMLHALGGTSHRPGEPEPPSSPGHRSDRADDAPPVPGTGTRALDVIVERADGSGFRGESLAVTGWVRARDAGGPVGGLRIDVSLEPTGGGTAAIPLGHTISRPDGRFTIVADIPADATLGDARVRATTPGDATWAPSRSE